MIAFLRGRLHAKQPQRVVVDVSGVGYDVAVPLSTFYQLGDEGAEVALRIHTHVREDQLALFGFLTEGEQVVFERLLGVSGIGPKLALGVLSGIEPVEFVAALERGDVALEDSIRLYERGAALKAHCEAKLKDAQLKVEQIVLGADGPRTEPAKLG